MTKNVATRSCASSRSSTRAVNCSVGPSSKVRAIRGGEVSGPDHHTRADPRTACGATEDPSAATSASCVRARVSAAAPSPATAADPPATAPVRRKVRRSTRASLRNGGPVRSSGRPGSSATIVPDVTIPAARHP